METAVIVVIAVAVVVLFVIIVTCCCCRCARKDKKRKLQQEREEEQKREAKKVAHKKAVKEASNSIKIEGTSNKAFQESKGTDTDTFDEIKKASEELTVDPPDNNHSWERVDINYNPKVDKQQRTVEPSSKVEVDQRNQWPLQDPDEVKRLQQRQEIDLGDPSPLYIGKSSMSSLSDKADDSVKLREIAKRESTTESFKAADSYKSSPYVAPYSQDVRNELGAFLRVNSIDYRKESDNPQLQQSPTQRYSAQEEPIQKVPRASMQAHPELARPHSPPAYAEHLKHKNQFRVESEVPVELHVPVNRNYQGYQQPSIPQPDYLEERAKRPNVAPKPSDVRRMEYLAQQENLKNPPIVPPKPSAYKKRDFRGPYGPEDLDEQNNPHTIANRKQKRYPLSYEQDFSEGY